jgi:putative transposase
MPHSLVCNWQHIVFSTKDRYRWLSPELQPELWPYMAGIVKNHGMVPLAINGIEDHVHLLIGMPGTLAISTAVQTIKANSSRWIKQQRRLFAWQEGFASFSVSSSKLPIVQRYIANQATHHKQQTFETELIAMLDKHGVKYDRRYIFG